MLRGSILQNGITIFNVYVPINRVSKCVRQKSIEMQREIEESTIIVDTSKPLYQKLADSAARNSVRTHLNSIPPSIN